MGMDSIEILMKVENTFGVKIPDREAEQILTVGDFYDAIWKHLSGKISERCKSQTLFYKLRKAFADHFNSSLHQFRLDSSPNEIFPYNSRRKAYHAFAHTTNLKLPDLELIRPWTILLNTFGLLTILGGVAISIILINFFDFTKWTLLIPTLGITLTMLLSKLFESKRTSIKASTIRVFTEQILALNYATLITENGTNRKEMEMVINHIIADMAGLDLEEVKSEKKIVDDLGID